MTRETAEEQRIRLWKKRMAEVDDQLIKCLECNLTFVRVGSHAVQVHGYETAREYRKAHGLNYKTGRLTSTPAYRAKMSRKVFENGTVNNLKKGVDKRFKKGGRSVEIVNDYWSWKKGVKSGEAEASTTRRV